MTDDPFSFDDDRTIMRPRKPPGTGGTSVHATASAMSSATAGQATQRLGGINALEKAASRLLPLLLTIRHSSSHPDPERLRNKLIQEINEFRQLAQPVLGDPKKVTQASYVMCTVMDDAAMNTPWGHQANWAQHNLLSTFHDEVIGGERFFTLLKGLGKQPAENIDLLELMYVCLSLGYEGRYRSADNGQDTLNRVRQWLYEIIASVRQPETRSLSAKWMGVEAKERKLPRFTVVWVIAAAALALTSICYVTYRFSLGGESDRAIAGLFNARADTLKVSSITPPALPTINAQVNTASSDTLSDLLQPQIDLGLVSVADSFSEGRIRLLGSDLFASGRAELNESLIPLVSAVANALERFNGKIVVTGHSDNIPIRSGRFASNLELSQARAASVASVLSTTISNVRRVSAEGRGSLEPIADNSTASGRSENRRVEISIYY